MLFNSKKTITLYTIMFFLSQNCLSMNAVIDGLKLGASQLFTHETFKIGAAGFTTVLGYYGIHKLASLYIIATDQTAYSNQDFNLDDEIIKRLSLKNTIIQALSIGGLTALATRIGPRSWPQLNSAQLAVHALTLGTGIGIASCFVNFYNKKNNQDEENALAQTFLTCKACINTIEIVFPISIVYYRYMHKK